MPQFDSKSSLETQKIAQNLVQKMKGRGIICLYGSFGAGKTTFTKGCGRALGISERNIKSPSFTYVREYSTPQGKLYHWDFYRFEKNKKYIQETFQEFHVNPDSLTVIEWPENIEAFLPTPRYDVWLEMIGENSRKVTIREIK